MLAACTGGGGAPIAAPTPTPLPATFNTSGSTNTTPFTFVIHFDGSVNITGWGPGQIATVAPAGMTSQIYGDILANLPVSNLPTCTLFSYNISGCDCAKATSFATTLTIAYDRYTSGDISCPASAATSQLWRDYLAIQYQINTTLFGGP